MEEWVVETEFLAVFPDQSSTQLILKIGRPISVSNMHDEWSCPVSLIPLYKRLADIRGGDAFQALCLAISLVFDLLKDFEAKGGKLLLDEEHDFPFEAYGLSSWKSFRQPDQ